MVFLGILAISGVAVFDAVLSGWSRSVTGTLTIQIPAMPAESEDKENTARTDRAITALTALANVESVRVLTNQEMDALLAPWLGEGIATGGLPLPALIDVALSEDSIDDLDHLRETVIAVCPMQ